MTATCPVLTLHTPADFSLAATFDCGQSFRFSPDPAGGVSGVACGRFVRFACPAPGVLTVSGAEERDRALWEHYFALDTDYDALRRDVLAHFPADSVMPAAAAFGAGLRILRQEPFETLITFILSQNNHIPRIRGLVGTLCRAAGRPLGDGQFAFPTPQALAALGETRLRALRTGFRAPYLADAAARVCDGRLDLSAVAAAPTTAGATERLMEIRGVGPKVAACVLLFGFGRMDAFPVDVWVRRSFAHHFGGALNPAALGPNAGLAQQYLFYYEKWGRGGA